MLKLFTRMLALYVVATGIMQAQGKNDPTSWWPDSETGMMWTGTARSVDMNYVEAQSYCSSLQLGGYSEWRLPTQAELSAMLITHKALDSNDRDRSIIRGTPVLSLKFNTSISGYLWTTTPAGTSEIISVRTGVRGTTLGEFAVSKPTDRYGHTALCVRSMDSGLSQDSGLLQLAKAAHPAGPVESANDLQTIVWIAKSGDDLNADKFQDAITDLLQALKLEPQSSAHPTSIDAAYHLGLAYGLAGQWDDSVRILEGLRKEYGNVKDVDVDLKLTKDFEKQSKSDPNAIAEWRLVAKAKAALARGDFQSCEELANQVIQLEPGSSLGYQYLGLAQQSLQQNDEAVVSLEKAWELDKLDKGNSKLQLQWAKDAQRSRK